MNSLNLGKLRGGFTDAFQTAASAMPKHTEEELREIGEFMAAYRPYHNSGDDALLWEWVERQIGWEPDPFLRAQLWFDFGDPENSGKKGGRLGQLTDVETREVLEPYQKARTTKDRELLRKRVVEDVRRRFRVYGKHEAALAQHGGEREKALGDLIASAIVLRGTNLRLGDNLVGKVDYDIARQSPSEKDLARLGGVEGAEPGLLDVLKDPVDAYSGVENDIAASQIITRAGLSPRELDVIKLKYLSGYSRSEVAFHLGIRPKQADKHEERGLAKLRAAL